MSNLIGESADPIASDKVESGRKLFFLDLRENRHRRFIKLTEGVAGHRSSILIPAKAFQEISEALTKLVEFAGMLPPMGA